LRDIFSVLDDVDSGRRSCDFFLVSAATKPLAPDVATGAGGGAALAAAAGAAGATEEDETEGGWMRKLVDCWRRRVSRKLFTSSCSDMSTATMLDSALWFSLITSRMCPMS